MCSHSHTDANHHLGPHSRIAAAQARRRDMSDGKAVVVFGATGTVGRQVLDFIVKQDVMGDSVKVVAVGTDDKACKELEKSFKERMTTAVCDAKDLKQVQEVFGKFKDEGLIGVVNLIGDYTYVEMDSLEGDAVIKMMQDNLLTSFHILKVGCPMLAEQGGGNVACVGAAVVHYGMKHHEAWAAAKGAIEAMHRNSAATWASKNVRINCVAAGLMDAPSSGEVSQEEVTAKAAAELYPLKRLATPEDIAWAVCWLTHPKTLFTTGVALPVDGGISQIQATGLAMAAASLRE